MNTLNEVKLNEKVYVDSIQHKTHMKRRLMDLGFVNGVEVIPILENPGRNMRAYLIKGCKIALRKEDSQYILIKERK